MRRFCIENLGLIDDRGHAAEVVDVRKAGSLDSQNGGRAQDDRAV
jgi:hypothetical protein